MQAAFVILALLVLGAALGVVLARQLVAAALWLIVSCLAVAGLFILLGAEFVAAVQILVYAGSVVVLFVFTIMTTGGGADHGTRRPRGWWIAACLLVAGLLAEILLLLRPLPVPTPAGPFPVGHPELMARLGVILFETWLLPLELFSFVVLAALLGAAVLRREGRER